MHMQAHFIRENGTALAEINFDPGNLNAVTVGFMGARLDYPPTGKTYAVVNKKFTVEHGVPVLVFETEEVDE